MIAELDRIQTELAELRELVVGVLEYATQKEEENRALRQQNNSLREQLRRIYEGDE